MKKYSLQTTTKYDSNLNGGTGNNRTTKVSPKAGQSATNDDMYIRAEGGLGLGTGTGASRYARSTPQAENSQVIGEATQLRTNSPTNADQHLLGPSTYNRSTPVRKKGSK